MPRNCAVTIGSSTTVVTLDAGFTAPNKRVARSAAVRAAVGKSNNSGLSPSAYAQPVCVSPLSSTNTDTVA